MSTILKALRRLEEDASSPSASGVGALPATDPRAADELRDRILAEETAAQLAAASQRDSNRTLRRLGAAAGALLFLVGILVLVLDLGFGPDTRSTRADSNLDSIAVVPPATPSPVAAPHPEDRRAGAAVAGVVPLQPTTERTAVSLVPLAPEPSAVATLRAPIRLPNQPASQPPISPETLAGEASSQSVSAETPPEAADQFALAAVAPTPALASAALTGTVTRSAPAPALAQKSPESAAPSSRGMSTRTVQNPASVSAPRSESVPKTRPRETRPSDGIRSEPEPRPGPPSDQVLRIDRRGLPDITVIRTSWHPNAERRSTRIRLEATDEILTLREGDSIGGLVIQEISPSAVLFNAGDVEIRRRVGEPGPDG